MGINLTKHQSELLSVSICIALLLLIYLREFGIRKGLKKLVISSKIRIFIGENQ